MKWHSLKTDIWSRKTGGFKGRKNNYKFKVKDGNNCWYVMVEDTKTSQSFNSLWVDVYFDNPESAKKWCKDYAIKNKNNRITKQVRSKFIQKFNNGEVGKIE